MMRKLFVGLTAVLLLLLAAPRVSAYEPVYGSESEAIQAETERLVENRYKPGSYPVTISYRVNGAVMTRDVMVTVKSDAAVVVGNIVIDAHSFMVTVAEAASFTDADWIERAQAYAWQTDTGAEIPIAIVDHGQVKTEPGEYWVMFGANESITIQVKATVVMASTSEDNKISSVNDVWFETYYDNPGSQEFLGSEAIFFDILKVSAIFMLLIPLLFLIIQYLWTSKAMRAVLDFMDKNNKKRE
ncbi:hypothetical protein [Culicoidibacter larvae]|uniref:Uncharacterized protein n=1 Tax=Culicoidibacter larvae TaxID=2579976 RepID=A0A5R8Q9V3_9FIRM|nr:hypothetical protein [Culicoidibacter larvae]TLG72680.1 hypothetical protein FEZ08_08175 [Culicoidibacter larvae]